MPVCHNPKYIGKKVLLEFAIGCGDALPATADWKRMGSMNTKSLSNEWDTDDTTSVRVGMLLRALKTKSIW